MAPSSNIITGIKRFWTHSIRRQLMLGIMLVHAVLMGIFVFDLVYRQRSFLYEQSVSHARGLAETLSANSASWAMASDYIGMEEVIRSVSRFPDLKYAMLVAPDLRIMAHTDKSRVGMYLADKQSMKLLGAKPGFTTIVSDSAIIDIASPVVAFGGKRLVAWARVGVGQERNALGMRSITVNGVVYIIIAVVAGGVFGFFIAKGLTLGLHKLVDVMELTRSGERGARAYLERTDELGKLSEGFNQMLDSIARKEARVRQLLDFTAEGIFGIDTEGRLTFCNPSAMRLLGYNNVEELKGKKIHASIHHTSRDGQALSEADCKIYMAVTTGTGQHVHDEIFWRRDGSNFPVEFWSYPIISNNQVVGAVVAFIDITERERSEKALRYSTELLERIFSTTTTHIAYLDSNFNFIRVNKAYALADKREPEFFAGKNHFDLYPHEENLKIFQRVVESGEPYYTYSRPFEYADHPERGVTYWDWTLQPVKDDAGSVSGLVLSLVNVTERKNAEKELEKYQAHLEELVTKRTEELFVINRELEAFAYSVSHDLRAPLRSVYGFSQTLLEKYSNVLDEKGRHYAQRINAGAHRMSELIDAILKLSRITRREMKMESVNLSEMARTILDDLAKNNPERNVEITVQEGLLVNGDASLLQIALENLLGNAWKFTSKTPNAIIEMGSIDKEGQTVYYIKDNGPGFDMQFADNLFGAFQRLHAESDFEGTGVGLATVQRIIHRHGGVIWAQAELGSGATFFFRI